MLLRCLIHVKRRCHPADLLVLPARLTRRAGRNVLHLPRDDHHRATLVEAFKQASRLRLNKQK
jgi:hypothetical protein